MMRILLVEDEPHIRHLVSSILRQMGHQISEADNGLTALELFRNTSPDLVMTDLTMPQMDGLELIEKLNQENPDLPIIAMSAYPDQMTQARQKGVRHFLAKPFAYKQLVDVVQSILPVN
jgi:CheY-like chemotaxis protein